MYSVKVFARHPDGYTGHIRTTTMPFAPFVGLVLFKFLAGQDVGLRVESCSWDGTGFVVVVEQQLFNRSFLDDPTWRRVDIDSEFEFDFA